MSSEQERYETVRAALCVALRRGPQTLRELSVALGAKEKDLLDHLSHVGRSLARSGERLVSEPSCCLSCGYQFEERTRFSRPGRCPACKGSRISYPRFSIRGPSSEPG
ncbi:MAG TPA: transcriptional regulator [Polyangiaceae bacterium]|nr:transcriptional regulator [Polyangiaceae bacterium]